MSHYFPMDKILDLKKMEMNPPKNINEEYI